MGGPYLAACKEIDGDSDADDQAGRGDLTRSG
jgi:hypothetical protein